MLVNVAPMVLLNTTLQRDKPLDHIDSPCVGSVDRLEDRNKIVQVTNSPFLHHLNSPIQLGHKSQQLALQPPEVQQSLIPWVGMRRNS